MIQSSSPARRRFLQFLLAVAAVHVVAITAYYVFGVERASPRTQRVFGWGWMAVTVAVVLIGLRRLRRARRAATIRRPQ